MSAYRNVKLPNELIEEIIRIIKKYRELGYMTHSEFVKDATRRRLEEIYEKYQKIIPLGSNVKIDEKLLENALKIYIKYKKEGDLQIKDIANILNIPLEKLINTSIKLKEELDFI